MDSEALAVTFLSTSGYFPAPLTAEQVIRLQALASTAPHHESFSGQRLTLRPVDGHRETRRAQLIANIHAPPPEIR